jgi:hypothetical protein
LRKNGFTNPDAGNERSKALGGEVLVFSPGNWKELQSRLRELAMNCTGGLWVFRLYEFGGRKSTRVLPGGWPERIAGRVEFNNGDSRIAGMRPSIIGAGKNR